MSELGKTLQTYRKKKYLSTEEVSSITKIKEHYITALEEEDMETLPARVYSIGFLRNLADLYDLSATELILDYDRLLDNVGRERPKREFVGTGKDLAYNRPSTEEIVESEDKELFKRVELEKDDTFSRIRKLSRDGVDNEKELDNIIERSKAELDEIALKKEIARELNIDHDDFHDSTPGEATFPTSTIMLEFEELMREEERFNTQKLRKQETERNINKTRNTMRSRKALGMDTQPSNGAGLMITVLLGVGILVLLYIIITALMNQ